MTETQAQPFQFQVVYVDPGDGLVVGLDPRGGAVGNKHKVTVIHDQTEYDKLLRTDPAYLSSDKAHILAAPDH